MNGDDASEGQAGHRRKWIILGLLFVASLLNYFDRQTLSILKPTIKAEYGLNDADYSTLLSVFMAPYIVMYILGGRLVDRWGARLCMSVFVGVWSMSTAATGFVRSLWQLGACRFMLGVAEPGNWAGGVRALASLFPSNQRGFAISVFSAGSAIGSMIAPPAIAFMALRYGWRSAFCIPGVVGLAWVAGWLCFYRKSDDAVPAGQTNNEKWTNFLKRRDFWAILLARGVSDPVWYFYLFWVPGYLQEGLGLSLSQAGALGWIPFLFADAWGISSASLSDKFVRNGVPAATARKRVLYAMACVAPVGILAPHVGSVTVAIVIFSLVCATCLTWTFNTTTLIADLFPRNATGFVVGAVGAAGATGGLIFNSVIGGVIDRTGYGLVFLITGLLHPAGALILAALLRRPKDPVPPRALSGVAT